jgi:uncharacterized protein
MSTHEIRDPIHTFIRLDEHERAVVDSRPFQRLRYIHQLALSYLVYPGATHRRFEHSLGVMHTASQIFDVVAHPDNVRTEVRENLPIGNETEMNYWRRVLRIAALVHDVGHLPFSHAAEKELLPSGWNHERITREYIESKEMKRVWDSMRPTPVVEDIVKLALGAKKANDLTFSNWESILAETITGDVFGADRIDYLLRDSYHAGVAYGRFDHHRLIDTLRILPPVPEPEQQDRQLGFEGLEENVSEEERGGPLLGVEEGGLESAESLLLARYFMYSQVYLHDIRRIYDRHLADFLVEALPDGKFATAANKHITVNDNDVGVMLAKAARNKKGKGHDAARRIVEHKHHKVLYHATASHLRKNVDAPRTVYEAVANKFGRTHVWIDDYVASNSAADFPVWSDTMRRSESAFANSRVLQQLPDVTTNRVYVSREKFNKASDWFKKNENSLI